MKKLILTQLFFLSILTLSFGQSNSIENNLYKITVLDDFSASPRFTVLHKGGNVSSEVIPRLYIVFSAENPNITPVSVGGFPGQIGWTNSKKETESNIFNLKGVENIAYKVFRKGNKFIFSFKPNEIGNATLDVLLPEGNEAPSFIMGIIPKKTGWYSLGFTGICDNEPEKLDFLYQPLVYSWKRFPEKPCITEEAFATTAATFVNIEGLTEGIAPSPEMIPYRYALSVSWNKAGKKGDKMWEPFPTNGPKGNSLFGLSIRNENGKAQPMLFAPLLGGNKSFMNKGEEYSFICKYLLAPGDWMAGSDFLLRNIFKYKNERQNAYCSINETFDNMLQFAMNDTYGNWVPELKANNYCFDVPGGVKNVSALHPLSISLVTGNENIYKLRALPMMEYLLSRERFLFSNDSTPGQAQGPSHRLKGPCVDIGELTGLHLMSNGLSPVFNAELKRLFGKTRKLNLEVETGGGSWQDYLARYQINHNPADLEVAKTGAENYLKKVYDNYSTSFKDFPAREFTTDFTLRVYDLYQLYEITGTKRFLDAARVGARHIVLWSRSNPIAPDSSVVVNKDGRMAGIFPGRRISSLNANHSFAPMDVISILPEQKVPAWQTSLVGTVPEAQNTYDFGPVMLTPHAAWMLRIAKATGDTLLRDAAYNAVVGRYANFPGYYFTSLHTNVYQRFDYPMHPYLDVKYNAMFYNHVWPHLALLMDFMVSDMYYRSNGNIDFPSVFAPGYAFLTSKVYGNKPGVFMGNKNVRLWVPQAAIMSNTISLNHIFGVGDNELYLSLVNTSPQEVHQTLRLNSSVIPWNAGQEYRVIVYDAQGKHTGTSVFKDGLLEVRVPAKGLAAYKIEKLQVQLALADKYYAKPEKQVPANRFSRTESNNKFQGTTTAMIIQTFMQYADFYLFSDRTVQDWKSAKLEYKIGDGEWKTIEDNVYPFEFEVHMYDPYQPIEYKFFGVDSKGQLQLISDSKLNN